ncbi:MAG: hypothetical protein K0U41_06755 [Gammaproteobacteria bacterium]|nr:hypothetical protein [Gammaproteobacteria bacterium]
MSYTVKKRYDAIENIKGLKLKTPIGSVHQMAIALSEVSESVLSARPFPVKGLQVSNDLVSGLLDDAAVTLKHLSKRNHELELLLHKYNLLTNKQPDDN